MVSFNAERVQDVRDLAEMTGFLAVFHIADEADAGIRQPGQLSLR